MQGNWTLGVLIGGPLVVAAIVGLLVLAVVLFRRATARDPELKFFGWGAVTLAVIILVLALSPMGFYPYKAEYHRWEPVSGEVEVIEKRLVGSGQSMEEKYVVRFDDRPQEYRLDDSRGALVIPGDTLTMACKRQWQWAATHGYVCRWGELEQAGGRSDDR